MKVPKFKNVKEERKFWDTHDSTDYLDDFEEAKDVVFVRPKSAGQIPASAPTPFGGSVPRFCPLKILSQKRCCTLAERSNTCGYGPALNGLLSIPIHVADIVPGLSLQLVCEISRTASFADTWVQTQHGICNPI